MLAAGGFQLEEPFFHPEAAGSGKADQLAASADDPMARDENGDGISGQALAHCPGCPGRTGLPSQLAVGHGPAIGYLPTKGIDPGLKRAARARIDRHIGEIDDLSISVGPKATDQVQCPGADEVELISDSKWDENQKFPLIGSVYHFLLEGPAKVFFQGKPCRNWIVMAEGACPDRLPGPNDAHPPQSSGEK